MKISWYPGHMNKARKELQRSLQKTRAVIEILDARAPLASSNPLLVEMTAELPTLKILNKSDLAEARATESWLQYFTQTNGIAALGCNNDKQALGNSVTDALKRLFDDIGIAETTTNHILVVGIPNVGKSTVINALAGRKVAQTGNEPAITKGQQHIRLDDSWMLIDTPGMMWPRLEDQRAALYLALLGSIRQTALDIEELGWASAELLFERHPDSLRERYSLQDEVASTEELMSAIARQVGALGKSGRIDWHKAAEALLNDFRSGKLGRISLETPPP